jgi:acetolactate synthase-1/2/3 large subunit
MHGFYAPNILTNECDVLIAIGMRFDDRITGDLKQYAKQATVIHFDIDKSEINKNVKADIPVIGDAKECLKLILPLIETNSHTDWKNKFKELEKKEIEQVWKKDLTPSEGPLTMPEVIRSVAIESDNKALVVTDVGQHQMFASRYSKFSDSNSWISSGGLGTMGFGLPAAIGAKLGAPNKDVVLFVGDGGFQMTFQELGIIMQYDVNVKIVVLNNEFLGMVRQWQDMFFEKRYASTEMHNPKFDKIAEAYGIKYQLVEERDELSSAVKEMLDFDGSVLMEAKVKKELNVFPMVPSGASVTEVRLS